MRTKFFAISALLVGFAFAGGSAFADNIPVQNGSFEALPSTGLPLSCGTGCSYGFQPIPGWTTTGVTGQFQPVGILTGVPDGSTVAFTNGGTLSQDLGVDLASDTTYTLSVWVGDRTDNVSNYTILLDAGSTNLCSFSGSNTALNPGGFADVTCTYTSGSTPLAGDLTVWLIGGSGQSVFDDVTVSSHVPEPTSIALEAMGLLAVALFGVFFKRKEDVAAQ
jgi:hypothetical protein